MDHIIGFIIINSIDILNCYTSIRKYYDYPIVIIRVEDREYTDMYDDFINCRVINFIDTDNIGDFIGYYYFYVAKPFTRAIIIRDNFLFNEYVDFSFDDPIKFFKFGNDIGIDMNVVTVLNNMIDGDKLVKIYKNACKRRSCFNMMAVIDYDFLEFIVTRHGLFNGERNDNNNIETIFGCICYYNYNGITSIF